MLIMKKTYKELLDFAKKWKHLGSIKLSNGTRLIGKADHIAPEAYLFRFFAGLSDKEIMSLEKQTKIPFPEDFKKLLSLTNGLHLFNTSLAINGLRISNVRKGDEAIQPISIVTKNVMERPKDAKPNYLFIGYYDFDASSIFIDIETEKVHHGERYSAKIHHTWENLDVFFKSEMKRLEKLFDENGEENDPDISTAP